MNPLISQIIRGEWMLDLSNGKSAYYSMLALDILMGKSPVLSQPKLSSIATLVNAKGENLFLNEDEALPKEIYGKVTMRGEIIKNGDMCTYGADEIVQRLEAFDRNPKIKGTILEIDGPGGATNAAGIFEAF